MGLFRVSALLFYSESEKKQWHNKYRITSAVRTGLKEALLEEEMKNPGVKF